MTKNGEDFVVDNAQRGMVNGDALEKIGDGVAASASNIAPRAFGGLIVKVGGKVEQAGGVDA